MTWDEFVAQCLPVAETITVEAYRGSGSTGPVYDQAQQVRPCFVDDRRKLVRAADGDQVVSETTVYAPLDTVAPPGSRVTLPGGRHTTVITVARATACGWALPEHLEIACQ